MKMLSLNIQKVLKACNADNLYQLSLLFGWTAKTVYKYTNPERVKALQLRTLSQIVHKIAEEQSIDPKDIRIGDIFDIK